MGRLHRERRKREKSLFKVLNLPTRLQETELGELRLGVSKAEARRRFLRKIVRREQEHSLLEELQRRATAEIQAEEDARFLAMLEELLPKSIWWHLEEGSE